MSLEAILAAIEASGEEEAAKLRAETEARCQQMMAEAERAASARREEARRAALLPAAGECARRLHHARLEALRVVGEVRERLVATALMETRARLADARADADYALVLGRLAEEAIAALGDEGAVDARCRLEVDPRDEALLRRVLGESGADAAIAPSLTCWGGVVARSADGRIVATNTVESRLQRALPLLRSELAAFFVREAERDHERISPREMR